MIGADLAHLIFDLLRDAVRVAGDQIAAADESVPVELGEIVPLAVAFTEVTERSLAGERRRQLFSDRVFVNRFVEAAIEYRKKVTHRRIGELARFLFGVVDIDVAAENEFFWLGFP